MELIIAFILFDIYFFIVGENWIKISLHSTKKLTDKWIKNSVLPIPLFLFFFKERLEVLFIERLEVHMFFGKRHSWTVNCHTDSQSHFVLLFGFQIWATRTWLSYFSCFPNMSFVIIRKNRKYNGTIPSLLALFNAIEIFLSGLVEQMWSKLTPYTKAKISQALHYQHLARF